MFTLAMGQRWMNALLVGKRPQLSGVRPLGSETPSMFVLSNWLFNSGLTPHGFCLLWEPGLIWTYALSDAGIGLAYFSISVALAVIARNRSDLVFRPVLWLFAAFILLCGTTHLIDVVTLWIPAYGFGAVVRVATALASIFTAIALWMLLPEALTFSFTGADARGERRAQVHTGTSPAGAKDGDHWPAYGERRA
jgi:hypothetical protein